MGPADISWARLIALYGLLIAPVAILLWLRLPLLGRLATAVLRMTAQLLFVGFYLQVVFRYDAVWLTALWLVAMILVADLSVLRSSELRLRRLALPVFFSLAVGTAIPMLVFLGLLLARSNLLEAQYAIPISGMILGNCLRADIIGIRSFFRGIRDETKPFELSLARGATLGEAMRPYLRRAFREAITPTLASMATIGLVALPGMMTGAILGGTDPIVAIQYQIAIMLAILSGTSITVVTAILLTRRTGFTSYGVLDEAIFCDERTSLVGRIARILHRGMNRTH